MVTIKIGGKVAASIEKTYEGQWSSDPALLKSLLDAGETILAKSLIDELVVELGVEDGFIVARSGYREMPVFALTGWSFLVPFPRPALEPKPLEWKHLEMNEEAIAVDGYWSFYAWHGGDWEIHCDGVEVAGLSGNEDGSFDTAKAAIHEWRESHPKSMIQ